MAAASRSDQCHQCKAFGHYQRDSPRVAKTNGSKRKLKKGKKGRSGDPSPKWCSYHKTNTHSDSQCHKKRSSSSWLRILADFRSTDRARLANIARAHLAQTFQPDPPTFGFSFSAMGASLATRLLRCWRMTERLPLLSTRYSTPGCKTFCATIASSMFHTSSSQLVSMFVKVLPRVLFKAPVSMTFGAKDNHLLKLL